MIKIDYLFYKFIKFIYFMDILDQFANDVTEINISCKNIEGELDFKKFTKLTKLKCNNNMITSLNNLPNSLIELDCDSNEITSLDNLPNSLTKLCCWSNSVKNYDELIKKYNEK